MKGRKPIPTSLKVLRGNPGKRPLPDGEVQPEREAPDMPEWLDDEAKAEWARLVPELLELGLLTKLDRAALTCLVGALSELKQSTEIIAREGITTRTAIGIKTHPAVAVRRNARDQVRQALALFGLSPADRPRVKAVAKERPKLSVMETLRRPVR